MQRQYVHRSYSKPSRWMYAPAYQPERRVDWKAFVVEFLVAVPLGSLLTVAIILAAQTL